MENQTENKETSANQLVEDNNENNKNNNNKKNNKKKFNRNINNQLETTKGVLDNAKEDQSWLSELKLASFEPLIDLGRSVCSKCDKKRKYFCYDCCIPLGDISKVPLLKLPLSVDVLHYPTELISKSTAIHSKVLAHDDVNFLEFPDEIPNYNVDETILLFPSDDSCFVKDLDFSNIKKVIFVESQWQNAKKILRSDQLKGIRCVKIDMQKTMFWRYQSHGDSYLATIEAIYYFFKEFHQNQNGGQYNGEYDNLLYYYAFFYNLIQTTYKEKNRDFLRKDNYIQ
ncbi:hypothetical protein DICPUDRAFT_150644 [Dictyostelium purpureum]|uniref:tRNA-uridine aminocarboxypropyltransferase 1 n=1 Tax=Dictyostelium purpureum TaxID=5786 RepID=F0ZGV6_DICPU|nr:uncharacterized protein DICPUDRAFT_150644 [Dictyostelium purpureum]EGC36855.1 hypothetical protein DICPUDRAFT_150644 [Dictyostelium purpureum]|eukprot:XP_003286653.1 hypothetical protein DICPUDRAFT_150644 [Dictyostelium purpureum]